VLETRPPSHSHLLQNPLCIAPGPPRGGWEFGFAGRACRLNTRLKVDTIKTFWGSRPNVTDYGLGLIPGIGRIFSPSLCPDRLLSPTSLLYDGNLWLFSLCNAARRWRLPHPSASDAEVSTTSKTSNKKEVLQRTNLPTFLTLFNKLNFLQRYEIAQKYRILHRMFIVCPNITSNFRTIAVFKSCHTKQWFT
jgi:hypothetical protein